MNRNRQFVLGLQSGRQVPGDEGLFGSGVKVKTPHVGAPCAGTRIMKGRQVSQDAAAEVTGARVSLVSIVPAE